MKMIRCLFSSLVLPTLLFSGMLRAGETQPIAKPGLPLLQLVSDVSKVRPGEDFTVGLFMHHAAGFHTYWKGPGVVGVATTFKWHLPDGFSAGKVQWPAPRRTLMASLIAYGYETDTCLMTRMSVPEKLNADTVTIAVRCGWMACARSCHPGWHDFALTLPVDHSGEEDNIDRKWAGVFEANRKRLPVPAPRDWSFTPSELAEDRIALQMDTHGARIERPESVYFFSYDNQVDSDEPQKITASADGTKITFDLARPEFAPENPDSLAGVIYHPDGWPGLGTKWLILKAPWKKGGKPDKE